MQLHSENNLPNDGIRISKRLREAKRRQQFSLGRTARLLVGVACLVFAPVAAAVEIVDLSLPVAPEYPCTWPAPMWPNFRITHYMTIGPNSAYNCDVLSLDGNTGTQMDTPPHSVPRPSSGLPNAGPAGEMFTDKIP